VLWIVPNTLIHPNIPFGVPGALNVAEKFFREEASNKALLVSREKGYGPAPWNCQSNAYRRNCPSSDKLEATLKLPNGSKR